MKLERRYRFQPGFLFLAPVLDVGFLLGLFGLLSTSFLLQPGVAVEVPRSPFMLAPQSNPKVVSVTGPPRETVYFENQEVGMEELGAKLDGPGAPGTLVIKADAAASYATVLAISNQALSRGIPVVLAAEEGK